MREAGSSEGRRGKRRRKRGPRATLEQRAERTLQHLDELARDIVRHMAGDDVDLEALRIILPLELPGPSDEDARKARAHSVVQSLRGRLAEAIKATQTFVPGHVYDFQSASADGPHSQPPDAVSTFVGYSPTGRPTWKSFVSVCVDAKEPEVDRLFPRPGERPAIIVRAMEAPQLKDGMLPGFGRGSLAYNVLGQVVAGLLPHDLDARGFESTRGFEGAEGRVALTLQIVETRSGVRGRRLRLNMIGIGAERLADLAAEGAEQARPERLRKVMAQARIELDKLGRRAHRAEKSGHAFDLEEPVSQLIARLRADVDRVLRGGRHRTRHAEDRHREGDRPTGSALADVRAAPDHSFFKDPRADTIIVVGKKGRAHVFSPQARHVTSLQLEPGELTKKTSRARWLPLTREELSAFRQRLER